MGSAWATPVVDSKMAAATATATATANAGLALCIQISTVLFLIVGPLIGIDSTGDLPQIIGLTIGILVLQAIWSSLWLRAFQYGPAEWAWRCATWWRRAAIRRLGASPA